MESRFKIRRALSLVVFILVLFWSVFSAYFLARKGYFPLGEGKNSLMIAYHMYTLENDEVNQICICGEKEDPGIQPRVS